MRIHLTATPQGDIVLGFDDGGSAVFRASGEIALELSKRLHDQRGFYVSEERDSYAEKLEAAIVKVSPTIQAVLLRLPRNGYENMRADLCGILSTLGAALSGDIPAESRSQIEAGDRAIEEIVGTERRGCAPEIGREWVIHPHAGGYDVSIVCPLCDGHVRGKATMGEERPHAGDSKKCPGVCHTPTLCGMTRCAHQT